MISHQHSLPFLSTSKMAEVDFTKNEAEEAGTAMALPVIQVNNTQEVVATSVGKLIPERTRILALVADKAAQCKMFPHLIRCLLGKEELTFDRALPRRMHRNRVYEKLHYRNMISYALQAQSAIVTIKLRLAKIFVLQKMKPIKGGDKVRDTNRSIQTAVVTFCKTAACYFALFDRLSSENKNVPLDGEIPGQHHYVHDRMRKAQKMLDTTQKKYQSFITENDLDVGDIEASLVEYTKGKKFLMSLLDFFTTIPSDELEEKLNDLLKVPKELTLYDIELGLSADYPTISLFETVEIMPIPPEFEFKAVREPLSVHFWSSLKMIKSEEEYKEKFFEFLFSDWRMDHDYNINLRKQLLVSREKSTPDLQTECEVLLERYLQKCMINLSFEVVFHALRIKNKQSLLRYGNEKNLSRADLYHIENLLKRSINQLRTIISADYHEHFLKYNAKKRELIDASTEELAEHEKEISKARKSTTEKLKKKQKEIKFLVPFNFAYLSQVLYLVRERVNFTDEEIIGLANYFIEEEQLETIDLNHSDLQMSFNQPVYPKGKRPHEPSQTLDEPAAKVSAKTSDNALEIIKNQVKQLSSNATINHATEVQIKPSFLASIDSGSFELALPTPRIRFLDASQIERMTQQEIEMEKATIPDLGEAPLVERALLQELAEISMNMMQPNPQFLLPRASQQPSISASHFNLATFVSAMQESLAIDNTNSD